MKIFSIHAFLALSSAFLISEAAQAGAIDRLRAFSATTQTAKGEFTQRVISRTQKVSVPNSGEFIFARPGKFRWSYTKPYEQLLVADGEKLVVYDKDLNQVTTRKLSDALGATPAAVLFGNRSIEKQFDLKEAGVRDGVEWLDAKPRSKDTSFESISIGFRDGELAAMELRDVLGQVTMLTFDKLERNPVVPAEAFRFKPPPGVDVLDN